MRNIKKTLSFWELVFAGLLSGFAGLNYSASNLDRSQIDKLAA